MPPYAKLCSAMLQLCKLCLMLGLCDYAKKQCWHNRAAPTEGGNTGHSAVIAYSDAWANKPVYIPVISPIL